MHSERIERFLREQMSEEESKAFMHDLECDDELREQAQITALMIKDLQERQTQGDAEIIEEVLASKKKDKIIRMVKWVGSIAAMFILLFGANLWYTSYKIDKVYYAYYTPYDASLARGGDDEAIKKELAELYNKLGTETDVSPIITHLQAIYDGIQANNDKYADYSYYENNIAWYLALAYIKDHNINKAKELLKPLADNGDKDATEIIKAIDSL